MSTIEKKFDEIEPVDTFEKNAVNLLGLYFGGVGADVLTLETSTRETAVDAAKSGIDYGIDNILKYLYKEEFIETVKAKAEESGEIIMRLDEQ